MRLGLWSMSWADYFRILYHQTLGFLLVLGLFGLADFPWSFRDTTGFCLLCGALISLHCELRHKEIENRS